jgi:hypothetical protein
MPDVSLSNHGSIFTFRPLTDHARQWIEENVDPDAPWWAGAIAVEPRMAYDLVAGMQADGLVIA